MKKLFLSIITFSILFVIGCQENSITDPITIEPTNKVQPDPSHQGTITLERMLRDPYPVMNSFFIINGEIEYKHRLEVINTVPPVQQYSVSLRLSISAGLTYLCTVCGENNEETQVGYISGQSNDTITLIENDRYILEKSYLIQGREDGMVLIIKFLVTIKDMRLDEIFLVLPEDESLGETEFNNIYQGV